jgi:HK97 family phage prohead protease
MTVINPDFTGWATKHGLKCSDGRTIMGGAFKHQDKMKVPLVWSHQHNDPEMVLGHAILEHREEGVYTRAYFNESPAGQNAKYAVDHGDVESLSIYANKLQESNKNVLHGEIKEVSLVLSGANPGAKIDNVYLRHGDSVETLEGEAIIYTDEPIFLSHSDEDDESDHEEDETPSDEEIDVQEVLETLDDDQADVVHGLLEAALTHSEEGPEPDYVQAVFETLNEEQRVLVHGLLGDALEQANNSTEGDNMSTDLKHEGKTVKEVFDAMSEEQQNVVYFMIAQAVEDGGSAAHSDDDTTDFIAHAIQEGFANMPRNLFETHGSSANGSAPERTLSHDELSAILTDAKKPGSTLKESFLAHAVEYGIEDIDYLFPDAKLLSNSPDVISRRMEWVAGILNGVRKSPFSRIKSMAVDITADEARAKGYVKGNLKKEEIIKLLKRVTTPTTIYKKQKLDRDDIIDIVDLNVVAWLKAEMRVMLDEEIARAILIGDGREPDDEDKVDEEKIRPIAWDNEMYAHPVTVPSNVSGDALVESILRSRKNYKGTGNPTMYTTDDILTDLILLKDGMGRRLYATEVELAAALRVKDIVVVEALETTPDLLAILVNIADYTVGADRGGEISMFEDFDIDYNQEKYLIETRMSGCLTKPKSAVIIKRTSGTTVVPTVPTFNESTNTITIPTSTGVDYYIDDEVVAAGAVVITQTEDVEARPKAGYNFPHNTDADWTFAYTA